MTRLLLLNGPNLNLLGNREPDIYGKTDLNTIVDEMQKAATKLGYELDHLQSNSESDLINRIHQAGAEATAFIIFNPAGFTHSSVALRDALAATAIPFIELHLSNVHAREDFRKTSYFSDIALGQICGFGAQGYQLALQACHHYLNQQNG